MAVRTHPLNEKGQSLLELIFMLPVMFGLILLMVRINSAAQVSIVNQRYSRAQALWLTFNSPVYPRYSFRDPHGVDIFIKPGLNRLTVGVSDKPVSETDNKAVASTQLIVRNPKRPGSDGPAQSEPPERANVRVRTTVALCTQSNFISPGVENSAENIGENLVYDFCKGESGEGS